MPDGGDVPTDIELKALSVDLKKATDEVKTFAEKVATEMKNLGAATTETKADADKALSAMNELSTRLTEVEQKMSRRGNGDVPPELKTLGQHVVDNAGVKSLMEQEERPGAHHGRTEGHLSAVPALWGTGVSPTNALIIPRPPADGAAASA